MGARRRLFLAAGTALLLAPGPARADEPCPELALPHPEARALAKDVGHALGSPVLGQACPLADFRGHPGFLDGKLSPLWAQELIGADLARKEVERLPAGLAHEVRIGVMDTGFIPDSLPWKPGRLPSLPMPDSAAVLGVAADKHHGNAAAHLAAGPPPVGVASQSAVRLAAVYPVLRGPDLAALALALENASPPVDVMNASVSTIRHEADAPFARIAARTLLVTASGNEFGKRPMSSEKIGLKGIVVGSLSPLGLVSWFSNDGPDVSVLAPSNEQLVSFGEDGFFFEKFGGTSGASPLVTGALANALAIARPLAHDEARTLLERTAIPFPGSGDEPRMNGAGMLNALKLVKVARRLRERGWPERRKELLADASIYDFKAQAQASLRDYRRLAAKAGCESRRRALDALRESFLLDSSNGEAAALLADAYRANGLEGNALFYESAALSGSSEKLEGFLARSWDLDPKTAVRAMRRLPEQGRRRLLRSTIDRLCCASPALAFPAQAEDDGPNPFKAALDALREDFGPGEAAPVYLAALQSPDPAIRAEVLIASTKLPAGDQRRICPKALLDPDPRARGWAETCIRTANGE